MMSLYYSPVAVSVCYPWKLLKKNMTFIDSAWGKRPFSVLLVILLILVRFGWAQWISRAWTKETEIAGIIFPLPICQPLVLISVLHPLRLVFGGRIFPPPFPASSHWAQPVGDKRKEMSMWRQKRLGNFFPATPMWQHTSCALAISCDCNPASWFKCVHAQLLESCPTLCDLMDYSLPGSSVHGDSPGKILKWGVGCLALLQKIFMTQGSNLHLLHSMWILYHWTTREVPH